MFAMGFAVFIAILLLMVKLPHRLLLRMLNYDLLIDFTVSVLVLLIHFGSFDGVMAANLGDKHVSGATVAVGHNGAGKTNLLEALYTLATLKPLRAAKLAELVRHGAQSARVTG